MNTSLSIQELIQLAVEGFGMLQGSGQITPPELQLTSMAVLNDSILMSSIIPSVSDSMGIKIEACTVMGFMSSFFQEGFVLPPSIKNLGVRAFTTGGDELMYVLSSVDVARFCGEGKAIEWLTNSIFQDNTPEHRVARAKLLVSRIETGLRNAICIRLETKHGTNWWATAAPKGVRNEVAKTSRAAVGASLSGSQLIQYTYLPHLKDLVLQNWDEFKDILADPGKYERAIGDLNAIRRDEAHNRPISVSQIEKLEGLYSYLAGAAATVDSSTVPGYLAENWRARLSTIVEETSKAMPEMLEADRRYPEIVRQKFELYASAIADGLARMKTVVVPPGKEDLQAELEGEWTELFEAVERMKGAADSNSSHDLGVAATQHNDALDRLKAFTAKYLMSELGK